MSSKREELLALAERCEAATGPDRELDVAIGLTGKFFVAEPRYPGTKPMIGYVDDDGSRVEPSNGSHDSLVPRFTASLDAAMTLADEGFGSLIAGEWLSGGRGFVAVVVKPSRREAEGHTPALALTAAGLRARAETVDAV